MSSCETKSWFRVFAFLLLLLVGAYSEMSAFALSEDFEDDDLDPSITLSTRNLNGAGSGLRSTTFFDSTQAFSFGRSSCPFNCFDNHTSSLWITFEEPTLVQEISFLYAELFDNWGSNGTIFIDGVALPGGRHFQGVPSNSRVPDSTFTEGTFELNRVVSEIELRVVDITDRSEIFLDDLVVTVPEPTSMMAMVAGGITLLGRRRVA